MRTTPPTSLARFAALPAELAALAQQLDADGCHADADVAMSLAARLAELGNTTGQMAHAPIVLRVPVGQPFLSTAHADQNVIFRADEP